MQDNTATSVEPQESLLQDRTDNREDFNGDQQNVDMELEEPRAGNEYPPPTQEYVPPQADFDASGSMAPPANTRIRCASNDEDDLPLRNRRAARESYNTASNNIMVVRDRPRLREPVKELPKKSHKKPGPKPYAAKPVMKNDMEAKAEVIREIEKLWGKGFIKAYIPKCHRPLVKKRRGGKRTIYRDHETDPKKWLPSVLKAVLMIARLTDDKHWLKKAMGEVVRYRIKNTGNRKPQLVTTDFDVIEDMLMKDWPCADSFQIRYKHLLMAQPKEDRQTDEDIEHILGVGSDGSDSEKDSDDEEAGGRDSYDDENMEGMDEDEEDFGKFVAKQDLSSGYMQKSGYVQTAPHYPPKAHLPSKQPKQSKPSLKHYDPRKQPPHQQMYGFGGYGQYPGYGPPMNGYGHPMPGFPPHMKGYPPPHMYGYGPYGGYGQQNAGKGSRNPGMPGSHGYPGIPPYHPHQPMIPSPSMTDADLRNYPVHPNGNPASDDDGDGHANPNQHNNRFSPFGNPKNGGRVSTQGDTPSRTTYGMGMDTGTGVEIPREASAPHMINVKPRIKREPGVEDRPITIDDFEGPTNYLGGEQDEEQDGEEDEDQDEDMDDAMRLEIEEAEAERRLIQLRKKKRLVMSQAKKNRRSVRL